MTKKEFIDKVYQVRANYLHDSHAYTIAKLLNTVAVDIYSESQRFLFELIQNADDAAYGPGNVVHFEFLPTSLIVCHKGRPFTEADIEAITDAGASTKAADNTKTGYKGIGFKSVFGKSKCVTICSDGYQFKFEKVANLAGYPWQIIPIWVEMVQLPSEVAQFIARNEYTVYTCLDLTDTTELQREMGVLLQNPQLLLFLRNVTKISVTANAMQVHDIRKQVVNESVAYQQVKLFSQQKLISNWLLKTFEDIPIPAEVQSQLENDEKNPEKLKTATITEVAFAAKLNNDLLSPLSREESLLFTYLPTKVSEFGFPILVNGTFLTNASREALHEDAAWNLWHFELLATKLLEWLELLLATEYRMRVLHLLPPQQSYAGSELRKRFDKSLKEGIVRKRIVLTTNLAAKQLGEVVLDKTGLASQPFIAPVALLAFIEASTGRSFGLDSFVHPDFKQADILVPYGLAVLERNNVESFFKSVPFRSSHTVADNAKLIAYLKELADGDKEGIWLETLEGLPFIYDTACILRNPENGICFPSEVADAASTELGEIPTIHPDVYQAITQAPRLLEWLKKLGVKRPSEVVYVTNVLIPGIRDKSQAFITKGNYLAVTNYLFRLDKEGALSEELFESLRELKVKTTRAEDSFEEAQFCYLANRYRPVLSLEGVIDDLAFISDDYLANGAREAEWYLFFKKLKAKDRIELETITANNSLVPLRAITNSAWVNAASAQAVRESRGFGFDELNIINGLKLPSFLNLTTSNSKFSKLFWNALLSLESDPRALMAKAVYRYGVGRGRNDYSVPVENYFAWFVREQACIPTSTGQLLKASEVWLNTKAFKEVAGHYLPVFDSTSNTNQAWRSILNFRNALTTKDYLLILSKIAAEGERAKFSRADLKTLDLVYQALSEIVADSTPEDRDLIQKWAVTGLLLTSTHTFELPTSLLWIRVEGFSDMAGEVKSLFIPENVERNSLGFPMLLDLLGVSIVDSYTPNVAEVREEMGLKLKLLEVLPFLAALNEKKRYIELEVAYPILKQQLLQTSFYHASGINLVFKYLDKEFHGSALKVLREKQDFYFIGDWHSPLNKYLLLPALGALLDLPNFDQELRLLLELDQNEMAEWLSSERIDPLTVLARCQAVDARTKYQLPLPTIHPQYSNQTPAFAHLSAPSLLYSYEPSGPVIAVEDAELAVIPSGTSPASAAWFSPSFNAVSNSVPTPVLERTYIPLASEEERAKIGQWAEAYVNRLILNEPERFTQVEWANEHGESYKSYDFKVIEHDVEKYIEVKGTPSIDKEEVYFSTSEWKLLFEQQQHYAIYRVFEVFQLIPRLVVIEYPSAQLMQGELLPASIALRL